jgi:hypothetical protein
MDRVFHADLEGCYIIGETAGGDSCILERVKGGDVAPPIQALSRVPEARPGRCECAFLEDLSQKKFLQARV